ncbi:unnamed protein product [Polarella glacialis]|uniref:Protein kinase domain-containing protein n=1 Tax=Polarella glacialis TaxID=89957 RepID=A0A813G849_POLGL|nr:unnamed protein product [Polarella glacialis]CAE8711942.1 unnamed protein product [Polarella glacialis]CAE8714564.1 unnamed protein product [Polarella glacialis]
MLESFEDVDQLWLVFEKITSGSLYQLLAKKAAAGHKTVLEENVGRTFFRQMLHAMCYIHGQNVQHRDIKCDSFMILSEPGAVEDDLIKLRDFFFTILSSEEQKATDRRAARTGNDDLFGGLAYMAPEIVGRKPATFASDCWSLGVVLHCMLVFASPSRASAEEPREDTVGRIQTGDLIQSKSAWVSLSEPAQDLVKRFLRVEDTSRISAAEALRHPWVEPRTKENRQLCSDWMQRFTKTLPCTKGCE